jgi:hypothetical protein
VPSSPPPFSAYVGAHTDSRANRTLCWITHPPTCAAGAVRRRPEGTSPSTHPFRVRTDWWLDGHAANVEAKAASQPPTETARRCRKRHAPGGDRLLSCLTSQPAGRPYSESDRASYRHDLKVARVVPPSWTQASCDAPSPWTRWTCERGSGPPGGGRTAAKRVLQWLPVRAQVRRVPDCGGAIRERRTLVVATRHQPDHRRPRATTACSMRRTSSSLCRQSPARP